VLAQLLRKLQIEHYAAPSRLRPQRTSISDATNDISASAIATAQRRAAVPSAPDNANAPADAAKADNNRLIFGAALAVHALMVLVALGTALVFSLIARAARAPESPT